MTDITFTHKGEVIVSCKIEDNEKDVNEHPEIKSCPFCKSDNLSMINDEWYYLVDYIVCCEECGARGPHSRFKEKATEGWSSPLRWSKSK